MLRVAKPYLIQYYDAFRCDDIILGQEMILQLENLMDDLDNPAYIYDTGEAHFRIEFIETFVKHTKAPWTGKPFLLELWQKAFIEALYSFQWSDEGYFNHYGEEPLRSALRRFKKTILLVSRKNGKSTLCSALLFTELMVGLPGSDIVCASNDDAQARILFDEAGVMRELFDPRGKRTHQNLVTIRNKKNYSKMFRLSERTKNKEGRNIDMAVLDESHELKDDSISSPIEQSMSTKDEPLFANITTEGFVNDGHLDKELNYARQVLKGEIEDPTILSFLYTQDSENEIWQDESSWAKSNPSLGLIKRRSYIIDQLNKAREDKGTRAYVLAKDFNWKAGIGGAWLTPEEYTYDKMQDNCPATFKIEDMRGAIGLYGVDLSETTDLCAAFCLIMRPGDNTKYFLQRYFIPENKIEEGSSEDKVNYLQWAKEDLIEVSPGNENDYSLITRWFVYLANKFKIRPYRVGLDRWNAQYLIRELEDDVGFDCDKVGQGKALSNAMKLLEADLRSKYVNFQCNPITRWNLGNVGMKVDNLGRIEPIKIQDQANRRIDGAIAMMICYYMYQKYRTEYLQLIR